ncbi:putative inorganic phosphate cotransporter [Nasonia vitripennis]|uniref:Major facilitator superfamily (MFS) profile domain-containing protein n=1 Tax=Nasonia vitripennis TaxID=7425 RepID=A0A7M7G4B2_NASVI|nr:putative inorganic phosphate cotransporter [Nasonia vitripennis]
MPFCMKCLQCVPQRWIIAVMGFFAFFNAYTLRVCLSIAVTQMVVLRKDTNKESLDETCPEFGENPLKNTTITAAVRSGGTFEWSEYTQGIILSSFYWGYVITHIPGGLLAHKVGPKYTLGFGILITAILTVITPTAIQWGDAQALITVRFLMGLCEGVIQPAMSCLLSQWIPPQERSVIGSSVYVGIRFGIVISSVISGLIMGKSSGNWPSIFHLFGAIGIVWFVFWMILAYNSPREHPFITEKEKSYLNAHMSSHTHENPAPFPWKRALTSRPFLALIVMQSGQDWCSYTIMSDLPKYMHSVLKLPVYLNGYASSMHQIGSWLFCMLMSWLSDWLVAKDHATITTVRKMNTAISSLGPGCLLVAAMYAGCNVAAAITLITIGLTLTGSAVPGIKVNVLDLSPNYAGTLMGISNGIGAVTGVLAPYTVGVLATNQTLSEWRLIFWIVAGVSLATTLNFLFNASGEVQDWNDPTVRKSKKTKKAGAEEDVNLLTIKENN